MDNEYELRYLPLFYEDMHEKITYIICRHTHGR